jgi:hypothetical protein
MKKLVAIFFFILIVPISGIAATKYCLYCNSSLLIEAAKVAKSQVGIIEKSGANDGEVEKYSIAVGNPPRSPYCAAGLWWSFKEACYKLNLPLSAIPFPRTGLANKIFDYAKRNGTKSESAAKRYDFIVWRRANTIFGHIEFIDKVLSSGFVQTIAFNSSKNIDGKACQGVFVQKRNLRHPLGRLKFRGIIGFSS